MASLMLPFNYAVIRCGFFYFSIVGLTDYIVEKLAATHVLIEYFSSHILNINSIDDMSCYDYIAPISVVINSVPFIALLLGCLVYTTNHCCHFHMIIDCIIISTYGNLKDTYCIQLREHLWMNQKPDNFSYLAV